MANFLKTFPYQLNLICSDEINTYFQVCFLSLISHKKISDGLHEHTISDS